MIEPYLQLAGRSEEAIHYYEYVFHGAHKHIDFLRDVPKAVYDYDAPMHYVLYGSLEIQGTKFHFSDLTKSIHFGVQIGFSLQFHERDEFDAVFHKLSQQGFILLAPNDDHFPSLHAVVRDPFDVTWYLNYQDEK